MNSMTQFSGALAILSAMITPAVLISACGSLILATSQRLNRVIERTRKLAETLDGFDIADDHETPQETLYLTLLRRAAQRTRLLQRSLFCLYLALSVFVGDSIVIAIVAAYASQNALYSGFPILISIGGALFMFASTIFLIAESRIALLSVQEEMDFVLTNRTARGVAMADKNREIAANNANRI